MTKTEGKTLDAVLPLLGAAYRDWKTWGETKDEYKDQFFALADQALERAGLALKTVTVTVAEEAKARSRAERHNPGWLILEGKQSAEPGAYEFLLQEDPALKPYAVAHDGVRYARAVSKGAVMVDDEWLAEADPGLYEAITFELPWGARVTVPVERLDKRTLAKLDRYIYTAPPRVSLRPPRAVQEGEE